MKLLHIDSSPLGNHSVSRQLTRDIVQQWKAAQPGITVEYLDLAADAPAHLDLDSLAPRLGLESLSEAQKKENEVTERLLSQFLAADVLVVGAPMYNFTIPSQLKAWIDRVAQAGRTFKYTDKGPQGLAGGKTVIVASSRGGVHSVAPSLDHQEAYLKTVFGFLGITDIRFVRAEGLSMGDDARSKAMAAAQRDIEVHVSAGASGRIAQPA